MVGAVSKSEKVAEMVRHCEGRGVNPYYAAYFEYFNRGQYYEAHDVLEQLWLPIRRTEGGAFYKGLIQLAGAFVHLQKGRLGPAGALFRLARGNLAGLGGLREGLNVEGVVGMIDGWVGALEAGGGVVNPLTEGAPPKLGLKGE